MHESCYGKLRITLGLGNIIYRRSMHRDSCHLIFFLVTCDLEVRLEPPTVRLAATEAVEGARKLRVGGGGVPTPKKVRPLTGVRGMVGAVPDQRRRSLGQCGAARCLDSASVAGGLDSGSAGGGCGESMRGAVVARGGEEEVTSVY
jgi:hypothetical protein